MGNPIPSPEELRHLYVDELWSIEEIRAKFRVKYSRIRDALEEAGIPVRKTGPRSSRHSGSWKGGRTVDTDGYVLIFSPDHPDANRGGYVREHRLVMEGLLGRRLTRREVVDHRNGNRSDNRPENLRLYACNADHLRETLKGRVPKWTPEGLARIREGNRLRIERLRFRKRPRPTPTSPSPPAGDAPASSAASGRRKR